ncbi:hypothetical protein BDR04DRAFT_885315 [Suillus decipiens]|nr:hypothetical protein BDR04DRAFT_885315 [Suillus decipiens]
MFNLSTNLRSAPPRVLVVNGSVLVDELVRLSLSITEQGILHSLAKGRVITQYDGTWLLESCGSCQRVSAASALRAHILTCSES